MYFRKQEFPKVFSFENQRINYNKSHKTWSYYKQTCCNFPLAFLGCSYDFLKLFTDCGGIVERSLSDEVGEDGNYKRDPKGHVENLIWTDAAGVLHFYCVKGKWIWSGEPEDFANLEESDCDSVREDSSHYSRWENNPESKHPKKREEKIEHKLRDEVIKKWMSREDAHMTWNNTYTRGLGSYVSLHTPIPQIVVNLLDMGYRFSDGEAIEWNEGTTQPMMFEYFQIPTKYEWMRPEDMSLTHLENVLKCLELEGFEDIKTVMKDERLLREVESRIHSLKRLEKLKEGMWWCVHNGCVSGFTGPYRTKQQAIDDAKHNSRYNGSPIIKKFKFVEIEEEK
jgi:hypothetical protein